MSGSRKKCMAFERKGVQIFLPSVVISSDLRRIADDVYFGVNIGKIKVKEPETELKWNPSWDDDEDDDYNCYEGETRCTGVSKMNDVGHSVADEPASKCAVVKKSNTSIGIQNGENSNQSERSPLPRKTWKLYNKAELFKNWSDQPNEIKSCKRCGMKSENNCDLCNTCSKASDTQNKLLETHQPSHQNLNDTGRTINEIKCEECGKTFKKNIQLKIHQKIHAKMEKSTSSNHFPSHQVPFETMKELVFKSTFPNELECKKCGRMFERPNQLNFHKKLCKSTKYDSAAATVLTSTNHTTVNKSTFNEEVNELKCKKCDRMFERPNQLNFHKKLCKSTKYDSVAAAVLTSTTVNKSTFNEEVNELKCKKCDRIFERQNQLNFHKKLCKSIKSNTVASTPIIKNSTANTDEVIELKCKKCGRIFERQNQLNFHRNLCKSIKPVDQLKIETAKKEDLDDPTESKVSTAHDDSDMKFTCTDCGRKFKHAHYLNFHKRGHTKVCKNCGDRVHETKLATHLKSCSPLNYAANPSRSVSDTTSGSIQLKKCNTCGRTFDSLATLKQHRLLHEFSIETFEDVDTDYLQYILPFACNSLGCQSRFSDKLDLTAHVKKGKHFVTPFGKSDTTYYYIQDEQLPPLNPYVLLNSEIKVSADASLAKMLAAQKQIKFSPRRKMKKSWRGNIREDIPFQNVYVCETCDRRFDQRNPYLSHIAQHKREEKYNCQTCDRKFTTEFLFNEHMDRHAADPSYIYEKRPRFREDIPVQSVYTCETCQKSFNKRNLYLMHLYQHQKEKFSCNICNRKFQHESMYQAHVKLHEDPDYEGRPGRRCRLDIPIQSVYTCETCGRKFKKRNQFMSHIAAHKNQEQFKCNLCPLKFLSESLLEAHIKRHEDPAYVPGARGRRFRQDVPFQSSYTCGTCQKTFEDRSLFLCHLSAHKREGKHKCTLCQQRFPTSVLLDFHMKRHSDPSFVPRKPRSTGPKIPLQDVYTCDKCERQFTNRQRYIAHLNYHRYAGSNKVIRSRRIRRSDIPISDVYSCETCDKRFTDRHKYILHLYWHTKGSQMGDGKRRGRQPREDIPFQDVYYCEQCNYKKSFTERIKYILHIRNHNLERSHKCDGCLKVFKTVQVRDIHKEKFCKRIPCKYKCNGCSDRFHNKITLARHFQRHHSKVMKSTETEIEYPCNQCSQTFNTTFGLTRHIQIYHPSSNAPLQVEVDTTGVNQGGDHNSSHSWDAHDDGGNDDDDDYLPLAASFCLTELNEAPSIEEETKRRLPRSSGLCSCALNKRKYKSQKFCHSLRCPCVQNGNRCSKDCECQDGCLNNNEMEKEQQQKFKEGRESMELAEIEENNASTPILLEYTNINQQPSTSLSKLIPTSEFISVDEEQDESVRQLSLEDYVDETEDLDPLADPLEASQPEELEISQPVKSKNDEPPNNVAKKLKEKRTSSIASNEPEVQTPVIISTSGSTAATSSKTDSDYIAGVSHFNQTSNLRCQFCKKNLKAIPTYISHILLHEAEVERSLSCPICRKEFCGKLVEYVQHLDVHNKGINLQCAKCSSKFKSYGDMEKHLKVHHFRPMECGACNMKFQNSQLMMSHWSKTHPTCQCGLCNVKYFSHDDLTIHMKSLHSPYDCLRCNERFNKYEELLDHFAQTHSVVKNLSQNAQQPMTSKPIVFKCNYCGDNFSNYDDFNEHLSNHLSDHNSRSEGNQHQRNHHQCGQCKASFTTPEDLHDHLALHIMCPGPVIDETSFPRQSKPNTFSTTPINSSFYSDRKIEIEQVNDNIQAAEVFTCPQCGKGFHNRNGWRSHIWSHKLVLCAACDSCFKTKEELRNHVQTSPCVVFSCEVRDCHRNFATKKYLYQHVRAVHGREKEPLTTIYKQETLTPTTSGMGFLTGRVTETEGGTVQIILGGSSFPVIVASTSLAHNEPSIAPRHVSSYPAFAHTQNASQEDIEEIVLD